MGGSLGARLRSQRERQQVALSAIAEQTKLKVSLLDDLERDDLSHWPTGIFRRSYIRAYARAIGLDPEAVVREFLAVHPDPTDEQVQTVEAAARDAASRRPPTRLRMLIDSALGARPAARPEAAAPRGGPSPPPPVPPEPAVRQPEAFPVDLAAVADLCTLLGRAVQTSDVVHGLEAAARVLDAVGVILWIWDPYAGVLEARLAHGYSADALAHVPRVPQDADNAVAAAFRSADARTVAGSLEATGALAVPILAPFGVAGVLALELRDGREQHPSVRALTRIVAAQLATLVGSTPVVQAVSA